MKCHVIYPRDGKAEFLADVTPVFIYYRFHFYDNFKVFFL